MATLFCRGCGKQIAASAVTTGANLCADCAKKAEAPAPKASAAPPAPAATAKSAIPEDLELELVKPPAPAPEDQRARRVPRHRLPEPVSGKPIDAGDPMRLYLIAGVALVAMVLGGLWYFLRETPSAQTSASAPASNSGGASAGAAKSPPASNVQKSGAAGAQKSSGSQATATPPPAFNENNPSNKRCFHAYLSFMQWAYLEGTELKSDALLAKYKEQVSVNGVDDPDVKGIYSRGLQVLNIGAYPLKTSMVLVKTGQDEIAARAQANEEAKKRKQLLLEINSMAKKAERRYGRPKPPPPKPAPEAKTAPEPTPPPEPAPAPDGAKPEEPPSLKPAQ